MSFSYIKSEENSMTSVEVQNNILDLLAKMNQGLAKLNESTNEINGMRDEVLTTMNTNKMLIRELQVNDVKIEDSVASIQVGLTDSIKTNLAQTIHINDLEEKIKDTILGA